MDILTSMKYFAGVSAESSNRPEYANIKRVESDVANLPCCASNSFSILTVAAIRIEILFIDF